MKPECLISSMDIWSFIDEERASSEIRLETLDKGKSLPSLVEYGYQLALGKLADFLAEKEEDSQADVSRML